MRNPAFLHSTAAPRLGLVDGLRGIAALVVCIHHISSAVVDELHRSVEQPVHTLMSYGALGVDLFFVLSGFVIALTLDRQPVTGRYAVGFAVRRSLRLDPPYLCSIALVLAIMSMALAIGVAVPSVSLPQLLAHVFYLQNILGYPDLNPVNWTLCLEVQFYAVLVFLLWLAQRTFATASIALLFRRGGVVLVFGALAALSALIHGDYFVPPIDDLFLTHWYQFFFGALCYWCRAGYIDRHITVVYILTIFGISLSGKPNFGDVVGAVSGLLLLYKAGSTALNAAAVQFLGRISYSLYLVHIPVGWASVAAMGLVLQTDSVVVGGVAALAGVAVSIAAAYVFYQFIEAPSLRLASRVGDRLNPPPSGEAAHIEALSVPLSVPARKAGR